MRAITCHLRRFGLRAIVVAALLTGCAGVDSNTRDDASGLPPILTQDEVIRPYIKIGRIQITREVFKTDALNKTDVYDWGTAVLRREAAKMGADAIIFPEIDGSYVMSVVIPSTEYRATGVAIKFK
ncbi:hypothetical protein FO488_06410 [Geobacter sp. FeAm09]|uniref:hypothetical protein n=1 Tax=Geobacter sp. FeAm09 TaxID=2597769 RepID=UPI0011ECA536|nr:hypothetical protein [Geobacter sp. FeAm09]QEM67822.1 hypothetical protein FO488_06410 [Geobacter sp. FeAm09]